MAGKQSDQIFLDRQTKKLGRPPDRFLDRIRRHNAHSGRALSVYEENRIEDLGAWLRGENRRP